MKNVSVIIPNLHSPIIGAVIVALRAQTAAEAICEIIVVGQDRYRQVQPGALVHFIRTPRPISAAAARNLGARAASGEYLLFLDADCLPTPPVVEQLARALATGYAAVGGTVIPERHPYWLLCSNLLAFPLQLHGAPAGERPCLPSFCLFIAKSFWAAVGGFDETFPAAGEDIDLSFRVRRAGYRLGCAPAAEVYHRSSRVTLRACWHNHARYGSTWPRLRRLYPDMFDGNAGAQAAATAHPGGAALRVLVALAFALRLVLGQPQMRRFWYALPGLALLRLAWYTGMAIAAASLPAQVTPLSEQRPRI